MDVEGHVKNFICNIGLFQEMNVRQNYKFEFWIPIEIRGYIISKQSQLFSMLLVGVKISSELGPWPMNDESFHVSPTKRLHKGVLVVAKM